MSSPNQLDITTIVLLIPGGIIVLPLLTMGMGFGGMMGSGWGGMSGLGSFGMVGGGMFLWPLVLVGIILLVGYSANREEQTNGTDRVRSELHERYAREELLR